MESDYPGSSLYRTSQDNGKSYGEWIPVEKETLTVIDTRREGESEELQLSNFMIIEGRESLNFELSLCKIGQYDAKKPYLAEGWVYEIDVEAE